MSNTLKNIFQHLVDKYVDAYLQIIFPTIKI